jgi:NADH-quinone oxidoreductase subunit L
MSLLATHPAIPQALLAFADQTPIAQGPPWAGWILWLPLISLVLCGVCAAMKTKSKLPAWITVACLGASFFVTLALYLSYESRCLVPLFRWFDLHWTSANGEGSFIANFSLYVDSLTLLWMLFVTGLGTLIALYASEYMEHDVGKGYSRFFAGISVFLFAMTSLVMADNLVMLYLGWEGVGFASYWLIGYFYTRPSAVAAAKKAFIVNRIGDLGLALAIWLIYHNFGTVEYARLFEILDAGGFSREAGGWSIELIPYLLMLGAFGKSAQLPLYVWLPDAMEGPTPVSALIHAATMVTAGVYLLCRMFPVMQLHDAALPTVAWIGTLTALLAATIGMAQYDIKRIMAYSTVSQLGYMFAGIGVMTTFGAAFHVFTHAFFKAVLFLTCGAIMHGFAGQLDLRRISGLRRMEDWQITAYTMLVGCLCLAGVPLTSGFFSKDAILAEAFVNHHAAIGWILLITAGLTAYYTFRVWFRVCCGRVHYEMGDEHHGVEDAHGHEHVDAEAAHEADETQNHRPHPPRQAINLVLVVISVGAILAALADLSWLDHDWSWVKPMVLDSSAAAGVPGHAIQDSAHADHGGAHAAAHGAFLGMDPHKAMFFVSGAIALIGIGIAWQLHLKNRAAADALRARLLANPMTRWLPTAMENKWYVDELYHAIIVSPMWVLGHVFALFDRYIIDWLIVDGIARLPKFLGRAFQPLQNGILQSYAVSMAGGAALAVVLVMVVMPHFKDWLTGLMGGGG